MTYYVMDIDGTLANCDHRLHHIQREPKDWSAFFAACHLDTPHRHMIELTKRLQSHATVVFVSGRSDECRDQTITWLERHDLFVGTNIWMRSKGDHRPDDVIKIEILEQMIKHYGYAPAIAFEDRARVVKAWRAAGIPCAQIAEGDF